jgi:DNA-binding winged helix-turn-helix (wHTH) protein/tetratricopeptide (TPR) repeat protein
MTVPYRFDPFQLNPATRELRENGELVPLPARAFDCLAYLIEHRDRAVGRDELIAAVWGRVEISDTLLSHTILKVRRSLGDTGNEQRTIRTVPRFGYRWIGAIENAPATMASADPVGTPALALALAQDEAGPPEDATSVDDAHAHGARKRWSMKWLVPAVAAMILAIAAYQFTRKPAPTTAPTTTTADAGVAPVVAMPALVLPAEVTAPDDWRWLRLGLMDLVANRLRDGSMPTMSSESVVGLLKQRGSAVGDPLHDPALAKTATLRVLPRVRFEQNRWTVRLDAFGTQRSLSAEAQAGDAITAGRDATDALLRKLGHAPDLARGTASSPALDDLLQRSGAAMLADQLDEARTLISAASPDLQQQPRAQQRMAQIELRAGDYMAVETRLHALLDRLAPDRDGALRARVLMTLAAAYVRQGQEDKAGDLYEEAIALRKGVGDHEVLGVAYLGRGVVLAQKDRFDEATAELSRARIELETIGDGLGVAGVDVNLGDFQLSRHRPADALPILRNAAREFEQLGAREGLAHALMQQASAEREMLEFDAAVETTQRLWPPEAHTNNIRMRWTLTCARAAALADARRFDEARTLIERVRSDSDARKDLASRAQADALAASLAALHGDAAEAARNAAGALVPALNDADPALYARTLLLQSRALRQGGRVDEAVAAVQALRASVGADPWRAMLATLAEAEQARSTRQREPALEKFAMAMQTAERLSVPEDLVTVAAPYLDALIEASQLDTARTVGGRIAAWADRDPRAATAQARLYRALGQDDAARKAEEAVARMATGQGAVPTPPLP